MSCRLVSYITIDLHWLIFSEVNINFIFPKRQTSTCLFLSILSAAGETEMGVTDRQAVCAVIHCCLFSHYLIILLNWNRWKCVQWCLRIVTSLNIGLNNGISLRWDCSSKPIAEGRSVWKQSIAVLQIELTLTQGSLFDYSPWWCHPWELLPVHKWRQLLMIVCSKCSQSNDRPAGVLPM